MEGIGYNKTDVVLKFGFVNVDRFWKSMRTGDLYRSLIEYDILGLGKTLLVNYEDIKVSGFKLLGKSCHSKGKKGRQPGGIGVLIKDNWKEFCKIRDFGKGENFWRVLNNEEAKMSIIIGIVCQPPYSIKNYDINLFNNLESEG